MLRTQHGSKFNRPPSSTVNQQYKQSIFDYKQKIDTAVATDRSIKEKYQANAQGFALLSKTRSELAEQIPKSANATSLDQDPAVAAIRDCLQKLEEIRQGKEKVMSEGVAMQDGLSAVEELMKVNSGAASKGEVFEQYKAQYAQHFAQNDAFEQQK